jgi:MFS family permease
MAPLVISVFRWLWLAQLVSNIGSWMQSVGAQWMLVGSEHAALLTALVSASALLPVFLLSLPAGVLADSLDRRWLLIGSNGFMALAAALLAILTWTGNAGPAMVLVLTFALGCGAAVGGPAWQAIQPDLVPRYLIPSASAITSANVNISRAIGPALAGALVAWSGPALLFAINAVSFASVIVALALWRGVPRSRGSVGLGPSIVAGLRYVRNAPGVRRIALRSAVFVVPASALWALLAVVAHGVMGQSSGGYGLMLGALGAGAVAGALALPSLRGRLSNNALLLGASAVYAVGMLAVAFLRSLSGALAVLVVAGVGWVIVLSVLNTAMMLTLPSWVRARSLAVYSIVFMGGQGIGSMAWGVVATWLGPVTTLLVATSLVVLGLVTMAVWPLYRTTGTLDRQVVAMPEAVDDAAVPASTGPVLIQIDYSVTAEDVAAFEQAARALATSRRRTGAVSWDLWQDVSDRGRFVEQYTLSTWGEHVAQREERITGYDRELERQALALAAPNPRVSHLVRPEHMPRTDRGIAVADQQNRGVVR